MLEVYSSNEIWGINIIIRTDNMPTYYCEEDDYAKSDLSALIEFHEGALQRILATGDQETATGLSQEIWAAKRVQELSPGSL